MASPAITTVILDGELIVKGYTEAAAEVLGIGAINVGRALPHRGKLGSYPELRADAAEVLRSGTPSCRDLQTGERWFLATIHPCRAAGGEVTGVVVTMVDMTEHRSFADALRVSDERMRLLIESAKDYAIFTVDPQRKVSTWNAGAEALLGFTEAEILGRSADIIFTPEDQDADIPRKEVETAATNGRAADERWHMRKDGARFYGSGMVRPLRNPDGSLIGFVKIMRDLTEQKKAEERLRDSEARLREADLQKNRFLAMLGHELRNPLAAIRGGLALLRSEKTSPETRAQTLPVVTQQVEHVGRLVEDLLDVARIVEGQLRIQCAHVSLQHSLTQALEMVHSQAEAGKFELTATVPPAPVIIWADPFRITQILVNLLTNAVKYSGKGGRIDVTLTTAGAFARVSIRDYGPGIAPEILPRIFEPFVQAQPTFTMAGGLGLGLAVVRQLVTLHGGTVEVVTGKGQRGAEFVVCLPLVTTPA